MDVQAQFQQWILRPDLMPDLRADLESIRTNESEIYERFYQNLEFGTGGLRGILGAGLNRMNVYTVRRASRGFAEYILQHGPDAGERGIVIGYDCRRMSPEFALEVGLVMAAAGVKAYVFSHLCPTPELSFAVRRFGAIGGVMITASHNPPEYNGYKVYGQDGGQVLPEAASEILRLVDAVDDIFSIPRMNQQDAEVAGKLVWVGEDVDSLFEQIIVDALMVKAVHAKHRENLRVVYTPLHGTGYVPVRQVLAAAGYRNAVIVPEQREPDGEFPTVHSPNPEEPAALAMAIDLAKSVGGDIVMGTDPDADRVGVAFRTSSGDYRLLTGNQTGGLLLDFLLQMRKAEGTLPSNGIIFKTIVTSELGASIAARYGIPSEDTLTGFKFIGDRIGHYERSGEKTFLFGYEESYGYLIHPFVRDKDAVQSCLLISEMAAWYKAQGLTLGDGLNRIFEDVGWFEERLVSLTMPGADGGRKIQSIMTSLRKHPFSVEGHRVARIEDYLNGQTKTFSDNGTEVGGEPLTLPKSDVIRYVLSGGSWLAVRPSGTEPKMKIYLAARGNSQASCLKTLEAMNRTVESLKK